MKKIFALVDCNDFFVSCERVFRPDLKNKPVIVLSSNDGCAISRSNEAKVLGIPMGAPLFKIKKEVEKYNIEVFSSNFSLYGDMSSRVMQTLSRFSPEIEMYSIDEAFLEISSVTDDPQTYARKIRSTVLKWTGIPVSVGIASTKTLAKLANHIAKKSPNENGVFYLADHDIQLKALAYTPVDEVWGVGAKTSKRLKDVGIHNALELTKIDDAWIQKEFGIIGLRTVYELRGMCCYDIEQEAPLKKGITVSRSFGKEVQTLTELQEAIASFASRAGEKLREENEAATGMNVFAMTSRFDPKSSYYKNINVDFETPTSNSIEIVSKAVQAVKQIFKPTAKFKKAGIMPWGLVPQDQIQLSLFDRKDTEKEKRLMRAMDSVNIKKKGTIHFAIEGTDKAWQSKHDHRSAQYTTKWDELPLVK